MRSAYLTLALDSEAEAERVYGLLTGQVFVKLRDRFATSWMLLHQPDAA
jgi:PhnB protein